MGSSARCPKCRALGLSTDCTDRINHANPRERTMNSFEDDERQELQVTISFPVPIFSDPTMGIREHATAMRDRWIEDPGELLELIRDVGDDYDLQVKPFCEL